MHALSAVKTTADEDEEFTADSLEIATLGPEQPFTIL